MASWIEKVEVEECKVITDGAKKTSHAHNPKLNESRIIDRSILKTSHSTYYDRMYLRQYEPDYVRRYNN